MSRLFLTLACGSYDRTIPLQDGTVTPEGIQLNFIPMHPEELFRRQARDVEFDAAEFSLSTYCILRSRGDDRMVAIPIFPSRRFRHSHIIVNRDRVKCPEDLKGKRIGATEYQQTAAVWIRGILCDDYGVRPEDVAWVLGGLDRPSAHDHRVPLSLPESISITRLGQDACLNDLLVAGEIDGVISAEGPASSGHSDTNIGRLFDDCVSVERDYYARTGIFPIMHLVVLKRDIYERHPWVARSLFHAFSDAQRVGHSRLSNTGTLYCSLPWLSSHLEELGFLSSGADLFSYGVARNRRNLQTFLRYSEEQHLLEHGLDLSSVFVFEDA